MAQTKSKKTSAAKRPRRRKQRSRRSSHATEAALAAYAHDIRTVLTGILAFGELLATSNLGERERRWAASIKASAEHLASLTTLAIDASKAYAGGLTLQQEVFRPRRLIDALTDSLSARAQTKGVNAEVSVADNLPETLVGDATRLRAALENLIDNAVKFTDRGAVRLDVSAAPARRGRTKVVFAVNDSGIGLTQTEIKRLFRPFAQASADIARRYGGAGLGLVVVKALAKLMGGDLTVTSTPGHGSTFRFTAVLPIATTAVAAADVRAGEVARPTQHLSILCVEDNPYGRVVINAILTELGHETDFVSTGEDAIAAVTRGYDAVLMDVALAGIDGIEATRRIRQLHGPAGRTPIIGLSGRTEPGDDVVACGAGMDFYLRKPVSPRALNEALTAAVIRAERSDTPGLHKS
ncbi:MAG TPA: ATP-binding protein [Xanthobacteraceae bacterium]|jgi:CheY-like chemotaxis protein/nitrogen-specific signal transduction histidine kinase